MQSYSLDKLWGAVAVLLSAGCVSDETYVLGISREQAALGPSVLREEITLAPSFRPRSDFDLSPVGTSPPRSTQALPTHWPVDRAEPGSKEEFFREVLDSFGTAAQWKATVESALQDPGESAAVPGLAAAPSPTTSAWTPVGSGIMDPKGNHRSGRIRSAQYAWDPSQNSVTLYLGSMGGGLWKYDWASSEWQPVSYALGGSPSVGAFLVHPQDPLRIVVATGDRSRYPGSGIYLTTDGGQTWSPRPLASVPRFFSKVRVDLADSDVLLASSDLGILRSPDRGLTWNLVYTGDTTDLVQDPVASENWYAGAPGTGVLESTSGGTSATFAPVGGTGGIGFSAPIGRVSLALCDAAPNIMYALIESNGALNGIYRSSDYGRNWSAMDATDQISWGNGSHTCALAVHPKYPDRVFVGMGGFQYTFTGTRGAPGWVRGLQPGHADYTSFTPIPATLSPDASDDWLLCTNDGGYCTFNTLTQEADTEGNLLGLNLAQVLHVPHGLASAAQDSNLLLAGTNDNGVVSIDASERHGINFLGTAGDGAQVAIAPHNTGDFWASIGGPPFRRYWRVRSLGMDGIDRGLGARSYGPTVMPDPAYGSPLMFTHDGAFLYWSYQAGGPSNWTPVNANALPWEPREFDMGKDPGELVFYVTGWSDQLLVMDTSIHGALGAMTWDDRTPPLPAGSTRSDCHISADRFPAWPRTIYYVTGQARPSRCYMSNERGNPNTWIDCTGNLNSTANFWELIALTSDQTVLFLATSVGVYRSDDQGQVWSRFMDGLPAVVDVRSLEIGVVGGQHILRIATNGAGFWERVIQP